MTYAEKRLIKERALKKNFEERLEKALYECFKEIQEIQAQGGLYENLGQRQEFALMDFVVSLERNLSLDYAFVRELKDRVRAFINQLERLDDNDLPAINHFIASYERKNALKVA